VEVPGGPEGEERIFFFEKKKQKTVPRLVSGAGDRRGFKGRRFLLLFFKKEALSQAFAIS
jgi:hypothetical protein